MLSRKRQLAGKIESEEGVAETLAAADAKLLVYDQKISFDPQLFVRNPLRSSMSKVGKITGKRPGGIDFRYTLHGSGSITVEPEWSKYIKGCGSGVSELYAITIGAVASGPFQHGEVITGGTSSATGRVIKNTANGTTTFYFVSLTGTFESGEVITGGTSGATATTGSVPSQAGFAVEPLSASVPSLTVGGYEDGIRKLLKGSRGSCKMLFRNGEPVMAENSFMGVEAGVTDTALLSSISYETTKPPVFMNATITCDGVSLKISELDIDLAAVLAAREDVGDVRGILSYMITDRDPAGSFNPEMLAVTTHDFHTKWFENTEMELDVPWGSAAGNKFEFYAPKAVYNKIDDEEREGIQSARCTFDLNAALALGDTEWALLIL